MATPFPNWTNTGVLSISAVAPLVVSTILGVATISLNPISTVNIADHQVTYQKIQMVATDSVLGCPGGSPSEIKEIPLGAGLAFSSGTLICTITDTGINQLTGDVTAGPGSGSQAATISNNAVTYAKFQQVAASSLVGNATGSLANATGVTLGSSMRFTGGTLDLALFPSATTYQSFLNSSSTSIGTGSTGFYIRNSSNVTDNVWMNYAFLSPAGNLRAALGCQIKTQATETMDLVGFCGTAGGGIVENWRANASTNTFSLTNPLGVTSGGTNQSTYATGDTLYASASNTISKLTIGSSGQIYRVNTGVPSWSTATYPNTTTANQILYSSATNTIGGLTSGNNGVLVTDGSGIPSISSTIPSATQDNITRLGTIANVGAAIGAAFGGTGNSSYTIGDLLQASASTTLSKLAAVATGNALISGGVGAVSSWGKIGLTTHVSGVLPYANGGTNASTSWTQGSIFFAGSSSFTQNNSKLFWDNTNFRLGLNTASPQFPFDVHISNSNTSPFSGTPFSIFVTNDDTTANNWMQIGFAQTGGFVAASIGVQVVNVANSSGDLVFFSRDTSQSINERMRISATNISMCGSSQSFGSGTGVIFLNNRTGAPSSNPSGGGILSSASGAGTWRGSGGTITTFGPADPHCKVCGSDFIWQWENPKFGGRFTMCGRCLSEDILRLGGDSGSVKYITFERANTESGYFEDEQVGKEYDEIEENFSYLTHPRFRDLKLVA